MLSKRRGYLQRDRVHRGTLGLVEPPVEPAVIAAALALVVVSACQATHRPEAATAIPPRAPPEPPVWTATHPSLRLVCSQRVFRVDQPILCDVTLLNETSAQVCLNARMGIDQVDRDSTDLLLEVEHLRTRTGAPRSCFMTIIGGPATAKDYRCLASGEQMGAVVDFTCWLPRLAGDYVIRLHYDTLDALPGAWHGVLDAQATVHLVD